jgi:hypothetical protein
MQLPTELRFMIFRYLFPEVVSAYKSHGVKVAVLKTNRQLYQEASSVLYGESLFKAFIHIDCIGIQGRQWYREPRARNVQDNSSANNVIGRNGTILIQNLEVEIQLGIKGRCPKGIGYRGISQENHELFVLRDGARKMSNLVRVDSTSQGTSALKRLTVKPTIYAGYRWKSDEAIIALFSVLEPFQKLQVAYPRLEGPITQDWRNFTSGQQLAANMQARKAYGRLEQQWLRALTDATGTSSRLEPSTTVQEGFRKIEAFAQLIHTQAAVTTRSWTSTVFQNLERPLHLARVAYENDDGDMIQSIHEAIKLRWINSHRVQQSSLQAVADSINNMFERDDDLAETEDEEGDSDGAPTPRELYPDAFEFDDIKPLKEPFFSGQIHQWTELNTEDPAPARNDPDVAVKMSGLRLRIEKDGKEWIRLKTPALIQQLQAEKQSLET